MEGEQLPLRDLDTGLRPLVPPPEGAVAMGPPELCGACGGFSIPYAVLICDPLSDSLWRTDQDYRKPLCLKCTIAEVRRRREEGRHVPAAFEWALEERADSQNRVAFHMKEG